MSGVPFEISSGRRAPAPRWRRTLLASAGVFLALALLVRMAGVLPGEQLMDDAIVGWVTPTGVAIFKVIKTLGAWQLLLPATLLLIWRSPPEARRHWWLWVAVMIAAPIVEGVGKEIVARPRPTGRSFGFPSGHVTALRHISRCSPTSSAGGSGIAR